MAADVTAHNAVLKEVWTSDNLEKQFYDENPFLDKLEKDTADYGLGDYAIVPVHTGRSGGYSVVPSTGSNSLNPADEQKLNQAQYDWTNHWFQVELDENVIRKTARQGDKAVASSVDIEVNGALSDVRKQITRQLLGGNGDALICQCGTTSSSNDIVLGAKGLQAIVRGWLYPGLTVDIGTTSDEDNKAGSVTITAVSEEDSTITVSGSAITTSSSDYVSIADARSGTTSYEPNGLRNIVGTAALGGIDPSTEPGWQSYTSATAQDLSLPLLYSLRRQVHQRTGGKPDWTITSLKQEEAFYKLVQVQARFSGDSGFDVGNVDNPKFAGMEIDAEPDVLDGDWFAVTKKDLFLLRPDDAKGPQWATDTFGGSGPLEWKQGSTKAVGGLSWHINLAARRRNSHAGYTALN